MSGFAGSLGTGLGDRLRIIVALMIRDLMARFGRNSLGFVWTVLEPMILCTGVTVIWRFIHAPIMHGVPIIEFVVTGYMALTLWRHMSNPLLHILRNNAGLLYHRMIRHTDILIARLVLEFISTSAALVIIYFVLYSFGLADPVTDPGLLLAGWLYVAWFFGGFGLVCSVLGEVWEPFEKFLGPIQYLALPFSGTFFMVDWLPGDVQKLALLNPSVHCYEMFRAGYFGNAVPTHYSVPYLTVSCCIMSGIGIAITLRARDKIEQH